MSKGKRVLSKSDMKVQDRGETSGKKAKAPKKGGKPLLIVGVTLAVLVLIGTLAYSILFRPPLDKPEPNNPNITDTDDGPDAGEDFHSSLPSAEPVDNDKRNGVYTVFLYGIYDGSNTDSMMVATLDTKANTCNVLSLPRDTAVTYNKKVMRLNAVRSASKKDIEALLDTVADVVGFRPNNYVQVNYDGFIELVDAIGGVEYDVPKDMDQKDRGISLKKGVQTLNGKEALMLCRYRGYYTGDGSGAGHDDFGRIYTQQHFLKACLQQMISLGKIDKFDDYVEIAKKNLTTDLTVNNIAWFAKELALLKPENINFYTLPTETGKSYRENIVVDKAIEMINDTVNPYPKDLVRENFRFYQP